MSDLENAITHWRRQMAAGGLRNRDLLDELESHLRDAVEQRMHSHRKTDAREAMADAILEIGPAVVLRHEFRKIKLIHTMKPETQRFLRSILIFLAIFFTGMGLVLPALAKWREQGGPAGMDITLFLIGGAMVVAALACGTQLVYKRLKA